MAALIDTFFGRSDRLSSKDSEILAFGSHYSANFQTILDCFIPKFKYDNLANIKTDRVNIVVFNLHQIKQLKFFGDTRQFVGVSFTIQKLSGGGGRGGAPIHLRLLFCKIVHNHTLRLRYRCGPMRYLSRPWVLH